MRDIKFRVWDGEVMITKDVVFLGDAGFAVEVDSMDWTFDFNKFGKPELIGMQFTGLTDKNGVEIYEGDILSQEINCMYHAGRNNKGVRFEGDQFLSGDCSLLGAIESFDAEVIGNIHENKELLNEAT